MRIFWVGSNTQVFCDMSDEVIPHFVKMVPVSALRFRRRGHERVD